MARACVEDTCSITAGNGSGNPNALALNVNLDPTGNIVCNPGLGLAVNIPISADGVDTCDNILHKNLVSGEWYVPQPGVDTALFTSLGIVTVNPANFPSTARQLLATISVVNPYPLCNALVVAYINAEFRYEVVNDAAGYWFQAVHVAEAVGGVQIGSGIHRLDDNSFNTRGVHSDTQQQFDMNVAVFLAGGAATTINVYMTNPILPHGGNNANASNNIGYAGSTPTPGDPPTSRASGYVVIHKHGVVH